MIAESNENLRALVQELSKKNPNESLLKSKTKELGIPYSNDLIILMSEVLVYLSKSEQKQPTLKDRTT